MTFLIKLKNADSDVGLHFFVWVAGTCFDVYLKLVMRYKKAQKTRHLLIKIIAYSVKM